MLIKTYDTGLSTEAALIVQRDHNSANSGYLQFKRLSPGTEASHYITNAFDETSIIAKASYYHEQLIAAIERYRHAEPDTGSYWDGIARRAALDAYQIMDSDPVSLNNIQTYDKNRLSQAALILNQKANNSIQAVLIFEHLQPAGRITHTVPGNHLTFSQASQSARYYHQQIITAIRRYVYTSSDNDYNHWDTLVQTAQAETYQIEPYKE